LSIIEICQLSTVGVDESLDSVSVHCLYVATW